MADQQAPHPRVMLTISEVAEQLRISRSSVYSLIHAGHLPAIRYGLRVFRVDQEALNTWINAHLAGQPVDLRVGKQG